MENVEIPGLSHDGERVSDLKNVTVIQTYYPTGSYGSAQLS